MSLLDFVETDEEDIKKVSEQIRLRIKLSVFAYAYEMVDNSLISDSEFDAMSLKVDPSIETGNKKLDRFFKKEFDPSTGMWIRNHPELHGIIAIYKNYYCG